MGTQLKQRIIMSAISVSCLIVLISLAHTPIFKPFFVLGTITLTCMALIEFYALAQNKGFQPLIKHALFATAFYMTNSYLILEEPHLRTFQYFILLGIFMTFFFAFFKQTAHSLVNLSITTFGLIYLTIPLTCILLITYFNSPTNYGHGQLWLTYILAVTKITDVGAYIIGKTLGKNKLAVQISPQKTIEGAIGGTLISICTSMFFYFYFFKDSHLMTLWQSIVLGLIISLLAQIGDLAESVLKRDAGVKDSSHLPGFGGILDAVDSLVFTLPFMYLLLQMRWIG